MRKIDEEQLHLQQNRNPKRMMRYSVLNTEQRAIMDEVIEETTPDDEDAIVDDVFELIRQKAVGVKGDDRAARFEAELRIYLRS